jgi:hypothetical protein
MNHDDGAYNIGPHMLYLVFLYYYESCGTFYSTGHKFRNADPIAPTVAPARDSDLRIGRCGINKPARFCRVRSGQRGVVPWLPEQAKCGHSVL